MRFQGWFTRDIVKDRGIAYWTLIILVTCFLVSLLPKPDWLCPRDDVTRPEWKHPDVPDYVDDTPYKWRVLSDSLRHAQNYYIDSGNSYVLSMFPLYTGEQRVQQHKDSVSNVGYADDNPRVSEFLLNNLNFSSFDRTWSNNPGSPRSRQRSDAMHTEDDRRSRSYGNDNANLYQPMESHSGLFPLPDCVYLNVPEEVSPAKICVHSGNVDNLISNNVRETGSWEEDHLAQMNTFFQVELVLNSKLLYVECCICVDVWPIFTIYFC